MKNIREKLSKFDFSAILAPVLFGVFIMILWQTQLLHKLIGTDVFTLPLPGRIVRIILDNSPTILQNTGATLIAALGGLLFGSLLGYLLGVLAAIFPKWGSGGLTIVSAFNAVPIIAIAPILNNLTKSISDEPQIRSMVAKILVVTLTSMIPMSVNAYRGLTNVKPFSEDLMKSLAASNWEIFSKLRLPNSVEYIFTALRISVPGAVISALVSEYFAEFIIGVGRQIRENIVLAQYATAWSYITVACLVGIILYVLLLIAEHAVLKKRR
ncbi:ABC transporter permease [Scatolibacter rhodanostii]|uniref:ABC transporter permease n=1 Tax=Scatolibacter rhodanostii TaxID=2014781 RepID=UPI000C07D09E|nr:ABC transporter permease subunit [Scatolibacter rhodanostii]